MLRRQKTARGSDRGGQSDGKAEQVGQEAPAPALTPHTPIPHPPPLTFSHVRLRRTQTKGLAARCATAVVKERYLISRGATGQPFQIVWPYARRKIATYSLVSSGFVRVANLKVECMVGSGQTPTWVPPL